MVVVGRVVKVDRQQDWNRQRLESKTLHPQVWLGNFSFIVLTIQEQDIIVLTIQEQDIIVLTMQEQDIIVLTMQEQDIIVLTMQEQEQN